MKEELLRVGKGATTHSSYTLLRVYIEGSDLTKDSRLEYWSVTGL